MAKVYFTEKITSESLLEIYKKLNMDLKGKVAVKVHSGEKGNQNYLKPLFYKELIDYVNGTVVECNTAYEGERNTTEKHLKLLENHEWTKYFNVDLLDEKEEIALSVNNPKYIKENYVGKNIENYDSILVLSHFKGHPMGGYGGALKNISIGLASSHGKANIHGAGKPDEMWTADHDSFLESMAEAAKTIIDYEKGNMVFINIMANMSVDCDCCAVAEDPCMKDIGILASTDPVALDQACIDLVYNSKDSGKDHLIERIESRNGLLTIKTAEEIGVGTRKYELIKID
ncbi:MAG: DUF362 domain-containing protein [Tenericutes bacterium]|nr:DUF362 domain-containing protein [Mycoplasmatota bacterium]